MSKESTLQIIFGGKNWKKETSPYGWRTHPITKRKSFHYGSDFSCNKVPVYAIEQGTVYKRGYDSSAGYYVYVYYKRLGVCVAYFHLSGISLKKGASVKKGTKIGVAGTTGSSTGVHLHVGVRVLKTWKWTNSDTWLANYTPKKTVTPVQPKRSWQFWDNPSSKGSSLIKAMQKWAGTKQDGYCGKNTVKAIQKKLKVKQTGSLDATTVKAIQKYAGVKQDGSWGRDTTTALQKKFKTSVDGIVSNQPNSNKKYLPKAY